VRLTIRALALRAAGATTDSLDPMVAAALGRR
jgi:hypothetical protein